MGRWKRMRTDGRGGDEGHDDGGPSLGMANADFILQHAPGKQRALNAGCKLHGHTTAARTTPQSWRLSPVTRIRRAG
eukprot:3591630-Pyramimonas_sp.AAC.2